MSNFTMNHGMVNIYTLWKESFREHVHDHNFKNGAFKELITADTPPLKSIAIFCKSDLLSDDDKQHFREVGRLLVAAYPGDVGSASFTDALAMCLAEEKVIEIFEEDMNKQGIYVAPTLLSQHLGKNNTVKDCDEIRATMERNKVRNIVVSPSEPNKDEPKEGAAEMTADNEEKSGKKKGTKAGNEP